MKHSTLSDQQQADLFKQCGAFFAFGEKQFREAINKLGVTDYSLIANCGAGMFALKEHVETLRSGLAAISDEQIKTRIAEEGIENIIQSELANYECQISGHYENALPALQAYGITEEQVKKGYAKFFAHCIEHDLF